MLRCKQRSIALGDNDNSPHLLAFGCEVQLNPVNVGKDLADDPRIRIASFQFDHDQITALLVSGKKINDANIRRILLAQRSIFISEEFQVLTKINNIFLGK